MYGNRSGLADTGTRYPISARSILDFSLMIQRRFRVFDLIAPLDVVAIHDFTSLFKSNLHGLGTTSDKMSVLRE